jgi:hypothetical protein
VRSRRLFNLAAGVSLLVCVASVALWVRSYFAEDTLSFRPDRSLCILHVFQSRGSIASTHTSDVDYKAAAHGFKRSSGSADVDLYKYWGHLSPYVHVGGFAIIPSTSPSGGGGVLVPHWFLMLVTAVLPAIAARRAWRLRRARRAGMQLCPDCGYDMRATPHRCPECGHSAAIGATA